MPNSHPDDSAEAQALLARHTHAIWRASQLGSYRAAALPTGHALLDGQLPGAGWPRSCLIELLVQQPGSGEMQLLRPALATIAGESCQDGGRPIVLLQPPHLPQIAAWRSWGVAAERILWLKASSSADALWSAEQVLKNGSCGALLFWQNHLRTESLRRLHLAAQQADTLFWLLRPIHAAHDASPAPLRLSLRPAPAGVYVEIVKRRGPAAAMPFVLPLDGLPSASRQPSAQPQPVFPFSSRHAPVDRPVPAPVASGSPASALV